MADGDRNEALVRNRSYISAVRKHGIDPLAALPDLFAGRSWMLPATS
ncbi:hypothetical protein ACIGW8_36905 [Streptomyces sioyaensis]